MSDVLRYSKSPQRFGLEREIFRTGKHTFIAGKEKAMKRALILGGGGARGSYQAGMLLELVGNQGIDFSILRGVSVGALNAAFLAQAPVGSTPEESICNLKLQVKALHELWTKAIQGNYSVCAERPGGFAGLAVGADSLYTVEPLRRLIREKISLEKLRCSGRDFAVGTVSLVSGKYLEWRPEDDLFLEKLVASASMPVIFPYVDIGDDVLVDGGARRITPLSLVFKTNPDEIYALMTSCMILQDDGDLPDNCAWPETYPQWDDNRLGTKVSGLDVLKRTVEILTDEIYISDLSGALDWNAVAEKISALKEAVAGVPLPPAVAQSVAEVLGSVSSVEKRYVPIHVLAPRQWYGRDNSSTDFDPGYISAAIEHGREIAANPNLWVRK
jgi:NTE family protein